MVAFKVQDAEPILSQGRWEKADLGEEHIRPFMPAERIEYLIEI